MFGIGLHGTAFSQTHLSLYMCVVLSLYVYLCLPVQRQKVHVLNHLVMSTVHTGTLHFSIKADVLAYESVKRHHSALSTHAEFALLCLNWEI